MISRTGIVTLAAAAFSVSVGVVVWRSIPDIPQIAPPEMPESEKEFPTAECAEENESETRILRRFDEQPLTNDLFSDGHTYRLILLPTFDRPLLIQARASAFGLFLKAKDLNGMGGYGIDKLGTLSMNKERELTQKEWDRLTLLLDEAGFWEELCSDKNDIAIIDGASWSLYGRNFDRFHRIHRTTPKAETLEAFRYLLRLAGRENDYRQYLPDRN